MFKTFSKKNIGVKDSFKSNYKGFTLIELLVVVLIIGILAAVAVSQYRKSVVRAKNQEEISKMVKVAQALRSYYLSSRTDKWTAGLAPEILGTDGKEGEGPLFMCDDGHWPCLIAGNVEGSLDPSATHAASFRSVVERNGPIKIYLFTNVADPKDCPPVKTPTKAVSSARLKAPVNIIKTVVMPS